MPRTAAKARAEVAEGSRCPPLLERWSDRIRAARDAHDRRIKVWEDNRAYAKGEKHGDDKPGLVRTNLIYANQATIVPNVYAKNPEIAVTPSKAVHPSRYRVVKSFAETLDIVLSRMFVQDTRLKQRMRSCLYSVQNTGEGWLKMIYQRDPQSDALIKARINDTQDNLQRLQDLIRKTDDTENARDLEQERDELKYLLAALEKQVEVVVAEGLVIDRVLTEDIIILDKTVTDFDYYVQADALDHMVWMTKDQYGAQFGGWPDEGAPSVFTERKLGAADTPAIKPTGGTNVAGQTELVCVHEVWHLGTNTVYTFAEGGKRWAREPFAPERLPERWYPFYRLGWNFLDGCHEGLPDVTLQKELQDEYNASRTQWADARKENRPVRLVRLNGNLTQEDLDNITNRRDRDIIGITGNPNAPVGNDIGEFPPIRLDPAVYDTGPIRADMEMVAGRGDAAVGGVVQAKTATEAEIQQAGLMGRSDFRRDVTEDLLQEMATAAAQILLQELTVPQVEQIAGEGAVWPMMAKWEVFSLVHIDIRAGSTSKPNRAKEREQWTQLLPMLQQGVGQIFELQMAGNFVLADAMRKLLKETLRKFEERLDLEELLGPEGGDGAEGNAATQQMAALQQQVQQLSAALQEAQAQLAAVDQQQLAMQQEEQALKREDMDARKAEREMAWAEAAMRAQEQEAKRQTEGDSRVAIQREQWDREDQRANAEREFQREQKGLEQQIAALNERLAATEQPAEASGDPELRAAFEGLRAGLAAVQETVESQRAEREQRQQIITDYLKGPRTDERLRAAVNQLSGG